MNDKRIAELESALSASQAREAELREKLERLQQDFTEAVRNGCRLMDENAELRKLLEESKVPEVTDEMIDRMINFLSRGSTMHHPDVPYLGTENGDTETAWKRRVMRATMEYVLAQPKEPKQ